MGDFPAMFENPGDGLPVDPACDALKGGKTQPASASGRKSISNQRIEIMVCRGRVRVLIRTCFFLMVLHDTSWYFSWYFMVLYGPNGTQRYIPGLLNLLNLGYSTGRAGARCEGSKPCDRYPNPHHSEDGSTYLYISYTMLFHIIPIIDHVWEDEHLRLRFSGWRGVLWDEEKSWNTTIPKWLANWWMGWLPDGWLAHVGAKNMVKTSKNRI